MDRRSEILHAIYDGGGEDMRLLRSRHGQLEYRTTMHYIHRALPEHAHVLEIGAGTGRYSIALAREGNAVTALEPVEDNLALLRQNAAGLGNLTALQGDALDLSRFPDGSFDLTLLLGPMYHLYEERDQRRALDEAIRVTRAGGMLIAAFLSVHAILFDNYLQGNFRAGLEENFTEDFRVRHFAEQGFTGFNVDEFEALFADRDVEIVTTAAADSILELAEGRGDFVLSDEDFDAFADYHLRHCERREMLGCSSHLITVCRKV